MRHKVKRIHFGGNERAQSRSLLQFVAVRPLATPANTDEAHYAA
ncbi:MAG: hypothetical protein Q7J21_04570 [Rugosibacter sp.]|nr:hypothetical protein [Rugosibacter sp.]